MTRNDDAFSFVDRGKESFRERLVKLIGNRSVRTAASDWGIPPSTLNNYIHKGTEPSFKIACLISDNGSLTVRNPPPKKVLNQIKQHSLLPILQTS